MFTSASALGDESTSERSRVRESYANRRRTSRARVNNDSTVKRTFTLMREFESDNESVENAKVDLERSCEILTLRGGELF